MKDESGGLLGALVVMVFFGWGWACKMCYFGGFRRFQFGNDEG